MSFGISTISTISRTTTMTTTTMSRIPPRYPRRHAASTPMINTKIFASLSRLSGYDP
uniref:Uncharacterized protein n=1 Tax=Arundo donax TaxID=35708 RepID=A0A0A9FDK1_ARUDO